MSFSRRPSAGGKPRSESQKGSVKAGWSPAVHDRHCQLPDRRKRTPTGIARANHPVRFSSACGRQPKKKTKKWPVPGTGCTLSRRGRHRTGTRQWGGGKWVSSSSRAPPRKYNFDRPNLNRFNLSRCVLILIVIPFCFQICFLNTFSESQKKKKIKILRYRAGVNLLSWVETHRLLKFATRRKRNFLRSVHIFMFE